MGLSKGKRKKEREKPRNKKRNNEIFFIKTLTSSKVSMTLAPESSISTVVAPVCLSLKLLLRIIEVSTMIFPFSAGAEGAQDPPAQTQKFSSSNLTSAPEEEIRSSPDESA